MADTVATITISLRDQASSALANVADNAKKVVTEVEDLGEASGRVGGDTAKLAGALSLVSPEAAEDAMAIADLADVVEVTSGAMKALGFSLTSMLGILAPIAVAIGALALVWKSYNDELEASEAKQKAAADEAERAAGVYRDLKAAVDGLNDEYEVAVGLKTKEAVEAEKAAAEVEAHWKPALDQQRAVIDGLKEEIANREKNYNKLVQEEGGKAAVAAKTQALRQQLAGEQKELEGLNQKRNEDLDKADLIIAAHVREAQARQDATDAAKAQAAAEKKAREEAATAAAEFAGQADFEARVTAAMTARLVEEAKAFEEMYGPAVDEATEFLRGFSDQLDDIVPPTALTDVERLTTLQTDLTLALSRGTINVDQYREAMERLAEAQKAVADNPVDTAATAADTANGGPDAVMTAVGSAGPWGALIAALVELVQNFADVGDEFNDFTISLNESIGSLPDTLADNLAHWLQSGTEATASMLPNLIQGIADNLPDILQDVFSSLPDMAGAFVEAMVVELPKASVALMIALTDPNTWIDVVQSFVKALVDAVKGIFGSAKSASGEAMDAANVDGKDAEGWWAKTWANLTSSSDYVGANAIGTDYVHRSGLAHVHEGERIEPATGVRSGRGAVRGGGGGGGGVVVQVVFNGFSIGSAEQVIREINRVLGEAGQQLAWAA